MCSKHWLFNIIIVIWIFTGNDISKVAGIRLKIAGSKSLGLFVAPITITVFSGSVDKPSQSIINCAFIMAVASWSCWVLDLKKESEICKLSLTDYQ